MVRPHSSLGYLTPAVFAAKVEKQDATDAQATGRIAAVYGASAPRPVAQPSRKGQTKAAIGWLSQVKRGPKKQGRSPRVGVNAAIAGIAL